VTPRRQFIIDAARSCHSGSTSCPCWNSFRRSRVRTARITRSYCSIAAAVWELRVCTG